MKLIVKVDPTRFAPKPEVFLTRDSDNKDLEATFKTGELHKRYYDALAKYTQASDYSAFATDEELVRVIGTDLYEIMSFAITSMPLRLSHVPKSTTSATVDFFKVSHSADVEAKFVKPGKTPSYLYHGSGLGNWHSITHNGIRVMSGTSLMTTGAVHGDGIYLSSGFDMSYNYCRPTGVEPIIMGVYEVYDAKLYQKSGVIHVVPDQDSLLLRYLVAIEGKINVSVLGKTLTQMLEASAINHGVATAQIERKTNARIDKDLAELVAAGYLYENGLVTKIFGEPPKISEYHLSLQGYPLTAPKVNNISIGDWTPKSSLLKVFAKFTT